MTQQLSLHWGPAARVRIGRGTLAAEAALLDELDELLDGDLARLGKPVLLVVPSTSLRRHLIARILSRRPRGAVLGLDCRTHLGLAASLLELSGDSPPGSDPWVADLFSLFARRLARREPALAHSLEHLRDGYGAVLGAVRDLLDAGFDPALTDALDEALTTEGRAEASRSELERARAIVRVAAGTADQMARWSLGRSSELLRQATVVLGKRQLVARQVLIYGFNDATGLTIDFLLALIATYGGTVYLDRPPDPAERSRPDPGLAFCRNFRERIETAIPTLEPIATETPPPRIETFRALGADAELREVGLRIRRLLDEGATAEQIGVVARQLDSYTGTLRVQFSRLAIPFSSDQRAGPYDPRAARLHAVLQLLREGPRLPVERWLDAAAAAGDWADRGDLVLALHTLAAGRLEEAANLDVGALEHDKGLALPTRRGFEERADEPGSYRAVRRFVGVETLARLSAAARAVCDSLAAWPRRAAAAAHGEAMDRLLRAALGWETDRGPSGELRDELQRVIAAVPADLEIDQDELQLLLRRELADFGRTELGGVGGGVRVLDVTAARSLSFDHLFLLGLNRGVFPRLVREDPLLTDPMRQVLARSGFGVLPDLPVKRNGFHEERYLFAQLLSASPAITLSWPEVDDQQKNLRAVSPLVERLRLVDAAIGDDQEIPTARPVLSAAGESTGGPRPAYEAAVLAGLSGDRDAYRAILEIALAGDGIDSSETLAAARVAVLDEADPLLERTPEALERLGPWLGLVGGIRPDDDPRPQSGLFVTALEGLAKCPWRHFLGRVLGLERLPDPIEVVPGVEPQLIGSVVHETLEAIVERVIGKARQTWDEALAASGTKIPWPQREALDELLLAAARTVVSRRNLALPGLDRALALAAAPHLETAWQQDWPADTSRWPVIATEVEGHLELPDPDCRDGAVRHVRFRADRMDRTDSGFSFTDYKTGKWAPAGTRSETAGGRLLNGVRSGEWLQAAAYALAASGDSNHGRYLYLNPNHEFDAGREYSISNTQPVLVETFAHTVAAILLLWDRGVLFPRFLDLNDKEPRMCSFCEVSDACVRGDSGARRRLGSLLRSWREGSPGEPAAEALVAAWYLAAKKPRGKRRP